MDRGVYALLFRNRSCSLPVGSLGEIRFRRGWHIYVGSARGPGGFARVARHRRLALSRDRPATWHVDHLLLSPPFILRHVVCGSTGEDLECALARLLGSGAIPSFGSSDCTCGSHLFHRPSDPLGEVIEVMASLGLTPLSTTIKHE
ncbi:MAG: GIY-YIG nuclease family protein [Methanomicrobiales archaeon]|jgi:Uri superfamily endonuclease